MPRLDLLPEDHLHFVWILLLEHGKDVVVESIELFLRKWAYIVEKELQCVEGFRLGGCNELCTCKLWSESHVACLLAVCCCEEKEDEKAARKVDVTCNVDVAGVIAAMMPSRPPNAPAPEARRKL